MNSIKDTTCALERQIRFLFEERTKSYRTVPLGSTAEENRIWRQDLLRCGWLSQSAGRRGA
jgi:hypothetical protein